MIDLIVDESEIELEAGESGIELDVSEQFIEGGNANLMPNKAATASTSQVVVQPDAGYDGMEKVTIEAIPEGTLGAPVISLMTVLGAPTINARCEVENGGFLETGEYTAKGVTPASILPTQAGTTITPTTSEQTAVDNHKWTTGEVKVAPIPSEYIIPSGTKNITTNGNAQDVKAYEKVNVSVPNSYSAGDEGKVVSSGALVAQTSVTYAANGTYDTTLKNSVQVAVPASAVDTGTKSISTNGTHDVVGYASASVNVPASAVDSGTKAITANGNNQDVVGYAAVNVNVPNTYAAGDEGKVVSNGALVAQTSDTVTTNDTYDTTLINSLTVNVSGGGGTDYLVERCNGTLTSYESDDVTSLSQNCFRDCTTLTSLKVYNCATVGSLCLYNTHIQKLALPSLTSVATQSLSNLGSGYLKELDLGTSCASLNNQGLTNNSALTVIVLRRTSIVALNNANVFNNTPFKNGGTGGTIYIPKSLYDHLGDNSSSDYKKATNWVTVNGYGTITWAKIEGSYYETHYADGTAIS